MTIPYVQKRLRQAGYYHDDIDGLAGKHTWAAIKAALDAHLPVSSEASQESMLRAPKERYPRQRNMRSFYGRPGGPQCTRGKVILETPMVIAWDKSKRISRFSCHEKLSAPFTSILKETITHYGEDEWRKLGLDLYGGCYNYRRMRGGSSISTHAYGAALDLNPSQNKLRWGRDRARFARPEYEPFWNIVEAHGFVSLGRARNFDFMHIQAARL